MRTAYNNAGGVGGIALKAMSTVGWEALSLVPIAGVSFVAGCVVLVPGIP